MGLDIRIPIGLMFLILGTLLVLYGLFTNGDAVLYVRSLGTNINLWWGLCLLIFGALMFVFGRQASAKNKTQGMRPAVNSAEGEFTEERERKEGMEGSNH